MNTQQRIVRALLYLYPSGWRREYGAELADLLQSQPLGARAVVDVMAGATRQRFRSAEPWLILGVPAFLYFFITLVRGEASLDAIVVPSGITFPTATIAPMNTDPYVLLLMICSGWAAVRYARRPSRAAVSAVKMSLVAGSPIVVAGLFTLVTGRSAVAPAIEVTTAPIFILPLHFTYGYGGAWLATKLRPVVRWIRRQLTTT